MHAARIAVCGALILLAAAPPPGGDAVAGQVGPGFSAPLAIVNPLRPFHAGGVKLYRGREGGHRYTVLEQHLVETRSFSWNGGTVACRILREVKLEFGAATEISRTFLAQGDDGAVYSFGEVPEPLPALPGEPDDDPGDLESNGWVVGAVQPGDPPLTTGGASPTVFMPADPGPGDTWKPEDLLPVADETDRVVETGVPVEVRAGLFPDCLGVKESTLLEPVVETKWYAPGVGVVLQRSRLGVLRLEATTLLRR